MDVNGMREDEATGAPARLVMPVASVREALVFYTRRFGWRLKKLASTGRSALLQMTEERDDVALLHAADSTESAAGDGGVWAIAPQAQRLTAGASFYIGVPSTAKVAAELSRRGVDGFSEEEDPGALRKLLVPTPEGCTAVYWEELFPADDELLAMYARGAEELQAALAGLSQDELMHAEAPGKWSIAGHVLHLVDLELVAFHKLKFVLAEPGRTYTGNGFSPDAWSLGLDYAGRSPEAELRLLGALREHVLGLCRQLPDALQRTVTTTGRVETAAGPIKAMAGHAGHHLRAIRRIRAGLNRS